MANKFSISELERLKKQGNIRDFEEVKKVVNEKGKSKYGNRKVELDGYVFDSIRESKRYIELRYLLRAGEITDLELQKEFVLEVNGEKVASYFSDFCYMKKGEVIVEDVKSKATRSIAVYRLKKKLVKQCHNIIITEV